MAQRKYISLNKLSTFLDNLSSKFASLVHKHTMSDITDYKVDSSLSSTSTNPVQNKVLNEEFEAISQAFEVYEDIIDGKADANHTHDDKYYTESEIDTKLSGKANTSHGNHVPTTQTANNATFLRNDNTWQKVTPANIGAAPTAHASTATTYGIGTSSNYGHVKLSDSTSSTSAASAGIAASPAAVKAAYDTADARVKRGGDTMTGNLTMGTNAVVFGSCTVKYDSTKKCLNFTFA